MAKDMSKEQSAPKKKGTDPMKFVEEVRSELRKVTWPEWPEWRQWTILVFIMVAVASLFFFLVDTIIGQTIQFLLGLGG